MNQPGFASTQWTERFMAEFRLSPKSLQVFLLLFDVCSKITAPIFAAVFNMYLQFI
jgi:hypothetical protein